jgi:glycosyltransferase involved in cell wall biosynthesis
MTAPHLIGSIDRIEQRWLHGWAYDSSMPAARLRVIVLLDGDVAGFATANEHRDELLESGVGDGAHAFRCELPPDKLNTARLITILAEHRGTLALVHERPAARPVAIDEDGRPARTRPAIHFDIADLLEYIWHHREVSGIQRVQCGYLSNALTMTDGAFEIRVCAQARQAYRYVEIAPDRASALILAIDGKRTLSMKAWKDYVAREREGAGCAPDFRAGDIILTMGAPWVHDDYYKAIEAAKATYGVRYFQICHDLIPTVIAEVASLGLIGAFNRSVAGMLDCAEHVLAVSRHSRADLQQTCASIGVACPPTSVIPLGGTIDYRHDATAPPTAPRSEGLTPREKYGDFVLCVGTIEPRKNNLYLYQIWKRMLAKLGNGIPKLVCLGRMGWHIEELQRALEISADLGGHFVHVADVSDGELKEFYRDCLFTVFPSFYEGWGLPVAESLFYRKLCVCSNATSMPEVGGDWVEYIDPHNLNNGFEVISGLIREPARVASWEARLWAEYRPLTWREATAHLLHVVAEANDALPVRIGGGAPWTPTPVDRWITLGRVYQFASTAAVGGPLVVLQTELERRSAAALLDDGPWHAMEPWGCWSCGSTARIVFVVPEGASLPLICYLAMRIPQYFGTRACRVFVNGRQYAEAILQGGTDHELGLELDEAALNGARAVAIEFHLDSLIEPDAAATDQRLLGIGLCRLCVCAADDREERLAYLERGVVRIRARGALPP